MLKTANIDYISVLAKLNQKYTKQQIADFLGITYVYLSYIETGKRNLSRQIMQKIDSLMSSDDLNLPTITQIPQDQIKTHNTKGLKQSTGEALIPYYDIDFLAGNGEQLNDIQYIKSYFKK